MSDKVVEFRPKTTASHNSELTGHYEFTARPAAKSSTSVATAATFCQTCGCRKGPRTQKRADCNCLCHKESK